MSTFKRALRQSRNLGAIATLALLATAASGQPDPEPIDLRREVTGDKMIDDSRKTDSAPAPASAAHACRFRLGAHGQDQIAGLNVSDRTPARFDRTYGGLLPVGDPAPARPLLPPTFLELDGPGFTTWGFEAATKARTWLRVRPCVRPASFLTCPAGVNWINRKSIY